MIGRNDFDKIEMRVGTVIDVQDFTEAKKPAYQLTIDFGDLGVKRSSAQITNLYTKTDLLNRQVVAVTNFPPKQIAHYFSECLVLGIVNNEGHVVLLQIDRPVKNGSRVG